MSDCSHIKEIICRNSETFHILLMLWCLQISPSHLLQKLLQSSPSYLVYKTITKVTFSSIRHYVVPVCHSIWKARLKKKKKKYCLLTGVKLCVCFGELDYTYRMTQYVLSVQRLMSVNLRLYSWFGSWLWQFKKKYSMMLKVTLSIQGLFTDNIPATCNAVKTVKRAFCISQGI